jgi:hypothetical protein
MAAFAYITPVKPPKVNNNINAIPNNIGVL